MTEYVEWTAAPMLQSKPISLHDEGEGETGLLRHSVARTRVVDEMVGDLVSKGDYNGAVEWMLEFALPDAEQRRHLKPVVA